MDGIIKKSIEFPCKKASFIVLKSGIKNRIYVIFSTICKNVKYSKKCIGERIPKRLSDRIITNNNINNMHELKLIKNELNDKVKKTLNDSIKLKNIKKNGKSILDIKK